MVDSEIKLKSEADRVAAVASLDLLREEPMQSAWDDAALLASVICDTPISLITVLDGTYQHVKAAFGSQTFCAPQEKSFCVHAIQQEELFIVSDTLLDNRFRENAFVTQGPKVRFYAGMPLSTKEGFAVGTLCVLDTVPRVLNEQQRKALTVLSRRVSAYFEVRERMILLAKTLEEKKRIESELRNSSMLFDTFMDNSPLICFMKEKSGRLIYYNRSFAKQFEISREAWLGKDEYEFFPPEVAERLREFDEEILRGSALNVMEAAIPGADGAEHHFRTYKFSFVNAAGERLLAGMSHEITQEKQAKAALDMAHARLVDANERLHELSITDALTGCKNRRFFDEQLLHEFALARRHHLSLSVLIIDVDNFKAVNDTYGHEEGDRVLQHVATVLMNGARKTDTVSRYGGEEFAILLPHTSERKAFLLADRMRTSIEERWDGCAVTISAGVGSCYEATTDAAELVRGADEALYRAKTSGKNRVVLASS